jgi:hypothetical protein
MGVDPASIAIIATVASTVMSVGGAVMQGMAQSQAAEYQAQVARNNAEIARNNQITSENNARATEAAGAARADQEAIATREMVGKQKAAAAASGLDVNSGTPVDITSGTAGMGMWSGLNIRDETNRRASALRSQGHGFGMQAENFGVQASAADSASSSAMTGGILGGIGAGVKGYAQGTGMLAEFRRTGVPQFNTANMIT